MGPSWLGSACQAEWLAKGGLGAGQGLAGPIGAGLLGPMLALTRNRATGQAAARLQQVCRSVVFDRIGS